MQHPTYYKNKKKFYKRLLCKSCAFMIMGSIILILNVILQETGKNTQDQRLFVAGVIFNIVMILDGLMGILYWKKRKAVLFWLFFALLSLNWVYRVLGLVNSIK